MMKRIVTFDEAVNTLLSELTKEQKSELLSLPLIEVNVANATNFFSLVLDRFGLESTAGVALRRNIAEVHTDLITTDDFLGDISLADPINSARLILQKVRGVLAQRG